MPSRTSTPTPAAAPLTRRRARTAGRILAAAREVFAEKGFGGASVEDICERAGFTRGAFYSNFTSKDDLVLRLFDAETDAVLARIAEATRSGEATLDDVVDRALGSLATEPPEELRRRHLLRGEFALHAVRNPQAGAALAAREEQVRRRLAALIEDVVARHGLVLRASSTQVAQAFEALHDASVADHLLDPAHPVDALERAVLPLLVEGLTGDRAAR